MADSIFKLKAFNTGSRISHVDACTSMGYAHLSYAHIVFQMSLAHWIKFEPKSDTKCLVPSLWVELTIHVHKQD
jgi:hypothetical protein